MPQIEFNCLPTIIGSMPQKNAVDACNQILHYLKDIPAWPQLPEALVPGEYVCPVQPGFSGRHGPG